MESKVAKMELEIGKTKIEREQEKETLERGRQEDKEKIENLQTKLKQMKQRENDRLEEGSRSRRSSIDRTGELEVKVRNLREDKIKLEEQLAEVTLDLSKRPEIDKLSYQKQGQEFQTRISDLENKEEVGIVVLRRMEAKVKEGEEAIQELSKVSNEMKMEKLRGDRLEGELDANKEAVLQRKVMRDKLEKYNELERENISLRSRNKLLVETAENTALLKEQVMQLKGEVARMEVRVKEFDQVKASLEIARKDIEAWSDMVKEWMTHEERESHGKAEVGIIVAKNV